MSAKFASNSGRLYDDNTAVPRHVDASEGLEQLRVVGNLCYPLRSEPLIGFTMAGEFSRKGSTADDGLIWPALTHRASLNKPDGFGDVGRLSDGGLVAACTRCTYNYEVSARTTNVPI